MRYSTIIVGTDGSESALKAVEQACDVLIGHTMVCGPRNAGSSDDTDI
jgi:hypothetical protein